MKPQNIMASAIRTSRQGWVAWAVLGAILVIIGLEGCNKDIDLPHNPYDDIDYQTPPAPVDTLDPLSFVAIHRDILKPRCAVPGCHDGHFEPDFRTVQSSHATLAFHPIIKNNALETFTYRVVPFDTAKSVLHERLTNCCFANQNDRMPQDNIGVPLEQHYIDRIAQWIMNGARNMFGEVPTAPNRAPQLSYYYAVDTLAAGLTVLSDIRIDGIGYNPFIVPSNDMVYVIPVVSDDSTSLANLTPRTLKCSYEPDNFSITAPGYRAYQASYFYNPWNGDEFHVCAVSTAHFSPDNVVYMRYFVSDGQNTTEFPRNDLVIQWKTYWSFYIQP